MNWWQLFLLVSLVSGLWWALRSSDPKRNPKERAVPRSDTRAYVPSRASTFHWPSIGNFDFEVVGESHYQRTIANLAGAHGEDGASTACTAELVPEDDNSHDPKAVAVRIQGQTIGYLARDDARSFRRRLGQKGLTGSITTCDVLILGGGTRKNGERLFYGVQLDLKPFE